MLITGKVVDVKTGSPLSGATVSVVNASGVPLSVWTTSGVDGRFALENPIIDANLILVSYTGYISVICDPSTLTGLIAPLIGMSVASAASPGEWNESSPAATNSNVSPVTIIIGVVLLGLVLSAIGKKKKKVSGINGAADYVVPVGILVGGYFLVTTVLNKLGLGTDKIDTSKSAADQSAADQQKGAGDSSAANDMSNRNFSDASLTSIATKLTDATSSFNYDYQTLATMLAYFSGFRGADAVKFLAIFVKINSVTLYQWYRDKISSSGLWGAIDFYNFTATNQPNFTAMGASTDSDAATFIGVCVAYVYKVANTAET
jgi:hypothetical protein